MTYDYDLVVIGAGGGGLTAAIGGAAIGAKTVLIEAEKFGGDCTHYGCVPSKTLIKAATVAHAARHAQQFGLEKIPVTNNVRRVLEHVQGTVDDIERRFESEESLRATGIDLRRGFAQFLDPHTVVVNNEKITAKKFVIASGARPAMLSIPGLEAIAPKTNRDIFEPADFSSLMIIGSGPIGCELAQAFARLGVVVTIVTKDDRILHRDEQEASDLVQKQFDRDGVSVLRSKNIVRAHKKRTQKSLVIATEEASHEEIITADEILVAVGRTPNVAGMGLAKIGVHYDARQGIKINTKTQTTVPHIYAVGDVASKWKFTHYANHMAKVAITNALLAFPVKIDEDVIARATFTRPEVASVGINTMDADPDKHHTFVRKFDHIDRAITDGDEGGYFKIVTDRKGMIVGATFVGESSGELINEIALAMKNKVSITALADTIHAYPTYAYGLRTCADQFRAMGYTKNKRNLVKKIFGLRG